METLLVNCNVDNFFEHSESTIKSMGNDISVETGVYVVSNISNEFKL